MNLFQDSAFKLFGKRGKLLLARWWWFAQPWPVGAPGFAPKELADLEDYYFGSDKVGRVRATNTSRWLVNPKHCSSVSQTTKNLTFPLGVYTFGGEQQGFIQGEKKPFSKALVKGWKGQGFRQDMSREDMLQVDSSCSTVKSSLWFQNNTMKNASIVSLIFFFTHLCRCQLSQLMFHVPNSTPRGCNNKNHTKPTASIT